MVTHTFGVTFGRILLHDVTAIAQIFVEANHALEIVNVVQIRVVWVQLDKTVARSNGWRWLISL